MSEEIQKRAEVIRYHENIIIEKHKIISELMKKLEPSINPLEDKIKTILSSMFVKDVKVENYDELQLLRINLENEIRKIKSAFYKDHIHALDKEIYDLKQVTYRDRMKLNKLLQKQINELVGDYFSPRVVLY